MKHDGDLALALTCCLAVLLKREQQGREILEVDPARSRMLSTEAT